MVILDLQHGLLSKSRHKSGQGFFPVSRMMFPLQGVFAGQDHGGVKMSFLPSQYTWTGGLPVPVNMKEIAIRDVFHGVDAPVSEFAERDVSHNHESG